MKFPVNLTSLPNTYHKKLMCYVKLINIIYQNILKINEKKLTASTRQHTLSSSISHEARSTHACWDCAHRYTPSEVLSLACPLTTVVATRRKHFVRVRTGHCWNRFILAFKQLQISNSHLKNRIKFLTALSGWDAHVRSISNKARSTDTSRCPTHGNASNSVLVCTCRPATVVSTLWEHFVGWACRKSWESKELRRYVHVMISYLNMDTHDTVSVQYKLRHSSQILESRRKLA